MFKLKKNKKADLNFTELTPVKCYEWKQLDDGNVEVLVPKFTGGLFDRILARFTPPKYDHAAFDEIGTNVWLLIDGKRKIDDIVNEMNSKFGESIHPAYERITLFFSNLHRNGFINFLEFQKKGK